MTPHETSPKNAILAVDDDTRLLAVYRHVCQRVGCQLLMAFDGAEALTAFRHHQEEIALVISDKLMPDMDGILLWNALRKLDPDIRFMMISGSLSQAEIQGLQAQGMVRCLRKPCGLQTLLAAIGSALAPSPSVA